MLMHFRLTTISIIALLHVVVTDEINGKTTPVSPTHAYQSESGGLNHTHLNHTDDVYNYNGTSLKSGIEMLNLTDYKRYNGTYGDNQNVTTNGEEEEECKFMEHRKRGIISEHFDFVLLRLKHILMRAPSNITELLELQQEEFKINFVYKYHWKDSVVDFNETRETFFNNTAPDSIIRQVPEEYHIAIMTYTGSMFNQFNKDTREVCSGKDIASYKWKSYFKLLQLAIETLGTQKEKWRDNRRFLYRGASMEYDLKEGQVIAFQHFFSTSASLEVAEDFFGGKSLFEFQGLYNGTAMAVWDHSYLPWEEEVLFTPLQVFRVDSIHVGYYHTRYVLAKHEMPVLCDLTTQPSKIGRTSNITTSFLRAHSGTGVHGNYALKMKVLMLLVHIMNS